MTWLSTDASMPVRLSVPPVSIRRQNCSMSPASPPPCPANSLLLPSKDITRSSSPNRRRSRVFFSMSPWISPSVPVSLMDRRQVSVKAVMVKVAQTPLAKVMFTVWRSTTSLSQRYTHRP